MASTTTVALLRRPGAWTALLVAVGAAVGGVAAAAAPHPYEATSSVYVTSTGVTAAPYRADRGRLDGEAARSWAEVATSPLLLQRVIDRLRLPTTAAELGDRITTDMTSDVHEIDITVADDSAARSAAIADAVGADLAAESRAMTPSGPHSLTTHVVQVQPARVPTDRGGTSLLLGVGLGAGGGLLVALVILIVRSRRRMPPPGAWRLSSPQWPGAVG